MIPIYEQGGGKGIGHNVDGFLERFDQICAQHMADKRAKAFALILYNFLDNDLRCILKNQGVFAMLDRLAGSALSVFYLHSASPAAIARFNKTFLEKLDIAESATLPCVIFFKLGKDGIYDVTVAQLDNADLIHGFRELYQALENYIEKEGSLNTLPAKSIRWLKGAGRFIGVEIFRAALRQGAEQLPF